MFSCVIIEPKNQQQINHRCVQNFIFNKGKGKKYVFTTEFTKN